jgi:hypothetical protein
MEVNQKSQSPYYSNAQLASTDSKKNTYTQTTTSKKGASSTPFNRSQGKSKRDCSRDPRVQAMGDTLQSVITSLKSSPVQTPRNKRKQAFDKALKQMNSCCASSKKETSGQRVEEGQSSKSSASDISSRSSDSIDFSDLFSSVYAKRAPDPSEDDDLSFVEDDYLLSDEEVSSSIDSAQEQKEQKEQPPPPSPQKETSTGLQQLLQGLGGTISMTDYLAVLSKVDDLSSYLQSIELTSQQDESSVEQTCYKGDQMSVAQKEPQAKPVMGGAGAGIRSSTEDEDEEITIEELRELLEALIESMQESLLESIGNACGESGDNQLDGESVKQGIQAALEAISSPSTGKVASTPSDSKPEQEAYKSAANVFACMLKGEVSQEFAILRLEKNLSRIESSSDSLEKSMMDEGDEGDE